MTLLSDALEQKKFDSRNLEKSISRGAVQADEVQKHLKQLPDDTDNAEWSSIESLEENDTR